MTDGDLYTDYQSTAEGIIGFHTWQLWCDLSGSFIVHLIWIMVYIKEFKNLKVRETSVYGIIRFIRGFGKI